jgi:hypothetical protein
MYHFSLYQYTPAQPASCVQAVFCSFSAKNSAMGVLQRQTGDQDTYASLGARHPTLSLERAADEY